MPLPLGRPDLHIGEGPQVVVEQEQLGVHSQRLHLGQHGIQAAKERRVEAVEIGLGGRPAPRPEVGIGLPVRRAVDDAEPHEVEPLRAAGLEILAFAAPA